VTQRDRIVVTVVALAAVLGAFWFAVLKPKRAEVADLEAQVTQATGRREAALAEVAKGEQARKSFDKDYAALAELGKAVPVGDQVPSLVYQIEDSAERSRVSFRAIEFKASGSGSAGGFAQTAAAVSSKASNEAKTVPSATQYDAATAPPGSAVGPAGFPTLPFSFKFDGDFFRMERFLSVLERYTTTTGSGQSVQTRGRLLTVDGIGIAASKLKGFPEVRASITATTYVLPAGEDILGGATPSGPQSASGTGAAGATASGGSGSSTGTNPTTAAIRGVTP
jgi:hypothetical protein